MSSFIQANGEGLHLAYINFLKRHGKCPAIVPAWGELDNSTRYILEEIAERFNRVLRGLLLRKSLDGVPMSAPNYSIFRYTEDTAIARVSYILSNNRNNQIEQAVDGKLLFFTCPLPYDFLFFQPVFNDSVDYKLPIYSYQGDGGLESGQEDLGEGKPVPESAA